MCTPYLSVSLFTQLSPISLSLSRARLLCKTNTAELHSYKFVFPFAHFYACGMWHVACGSCQPRLLPLLLTFEFEFEHNTQIHTLLNLN